MVDEIELPFFPLDGLTLFPRQMLPLYVFEPRYRELFSDLEQWGNMVAMGAYDRGAKIQDDDPVYPLMGWGQVVNQELNPDGTSQVLLRGKARLKLIKELKVQDKPYRIARFAVLQDEAVSTPGPILAFKRRALLKNIEKHLATLASVKGGKDKLQQLYKEMEQVWDLSQLTDYVAAHFLSELAWRLKLMEVLAPDLRLRLLSEALSNRPPEGLSLN